MRRDGVSVLAIVLVLAAIAMILVVASSDLWRGSSRTLFSVQETRELVNLARSTLSEAYYLVQVKLDRAEPEWFDWCIKKRAVPARPVDTPLSHQNASAMTESPEALRYEVGDVTATRVRGVHLYSPPGELGIVDLKVTVRVIRASPHHEATLTMTQRHDFHLAENAGPHAGVGRHLELSQTPAATQIEED